MPRPKYLSTSEMVTGIQKKTKLPIETVVQMPGDYRIYRPTCHDVLCGRGAPIQNHEGNVRMRRIVSKFTKRYFNSRKYRKQLIAEEAVQKVKSSAGGVKARFLKRVGRENFWAEVDDRVACDKVSHALRCMVRKKDEEGSNENDEEWTDEESTHSNEKDALVLPPNPPAKTSAAEQEASFQRDLANIVEKSKVGISTLQSQLRVPSSSIQPSTGLQLSSSVSVPPGLLGTLTSAPAPAINVRANVAKVPAIGRSVAERELNYRFSLQQMSNNELIDLVAKERAHRQLLGLSAPNVAPAPSILPGNPLMASQTPVTLLGLNQNILSQARVRDFLTRDLLTSSLQQQAPDDGVGS